MIHLTLHFLIPALVSISAYRHQWRRAYLLMMATMLVDLDHLIATPIYDPSRCSIGFHPLHSHWLIALYAALCCFRTTRLAGIGLIIHMALDSLDCQLTGGTWTYL